MDKRLKHRTATAKLLEKNREESLWYWPWLQLFVYDIKCKSDQSKNKQVVLCQPKSFCIAKEIMRQHTVLGK